MALELSKLLTYETYYDKLQTFLGEKNKQLHYMDADSFVLSVNTKEIVKDLKCFKDLFDCSNLFENCQLFSNRNKKVIGKYKIETPKIIWIDEFVCLRSKINAFKYGDDSKKKLKGLSKSYSKNTKFDYLCLDNEKYHQEGDSYINRSLNHEIYLQKVSGNSLAIFDDKSFYESDIECKPWN